MQEMDFYELSRAVQDRFTVSIRGEGQPRPLLVLRAGPPREVLVWSAIGAAGLLFFLVLVDLGFGDLKSALAVHPAPLAGAYALLAATVAISVMKVLSVLKQRWGLPYRPGVYLFPAGVID